MEETLLVARASRGEECSDEIEETRAVFAGQGFDDKIGRVIGRGGDES